MHNPMEQHPITPDWLQRQPELKTTIAKDNPNYWNADPQCLTTSSNIHTLNFGTGSSLYETSILPAIATADSEVILVTCFWARSRTLDALNNTLLQLSAKAIKTGKKIRIRICFSSLSIFQKLFHTTSLQGRTYAPSEWQRTLGLPPAEEMAGLDLEVKSIFIRPFSVMHPKFVVIDRKRVFLPSCNISWEDWFEGSVELSGPVVGQFVRFWKDFWASEREQYAGFIEGSRAEDDLVQNNSTSGTSASPSLPIHELHASVQSMFLPSPHHRNPRFALLPWRPCPPPPPTPLNTFILAALANAQHSIYIQTPNLTCPPVLSALLKALARGVNIEILTSERLMILEQLGTAGTTTKRCVKKLIKRHERLVAEYKARIRGDADPVLLESGELGRKQPGRLTVHYYRADPSGAGISGSAEPVQSHLKLTIVDGEVTVLGSGNMDRASWFTSQELGVAFFSKEFAAYVRSELDPMMVGRRKCVYDAR
ncbi:hypothetical protein LTR37_007755 [Vermiconidia calcicola]|uniref:Uncharacterized protein n=1 Tax=Vermiconidia calcicola TaxID=1690605 RepID=A0ACC3NDQ2_9PEZI|nr:hypothetical protein LTR37_007755 [Vermiconidia calcicola]